MVEQALNVLTLHIFWKAKGLLVNKEGISEDNPYQEQLVQQRASLLEKLQEYAIGTQSNTGEGVRRAVSNLSSFLQPPLMFPFSGIQALPQSSHSLLSRPTPLA